MVFTNIKYCNLNLVGQILMRKNRNSKVFFANAPILMLNLSRHQLMLTKPNTNDMSESCQLTYAGLSPGFPPLIYIIPDFNNS